MYSWINHEWHEVTNRHSGFQIHPIFIIYIPCFLYGVSQKTLALGVFGMGIEMIILSNFLWTFSVNGKLYISVIMSFEVFAF